MRLRNSIVLVHRWLALGAGAFWAITSLTGGVLVFERELDRWLNAGRFGATEGKLPAGALDRALANFLPGEAVRSLIWLREDHVMRVVLSGASGERVVFLDGGTGRVIENVRPHRPWVAAVGRLHTAFLAGQAGYLLVRTASGAAVLSLLTGLYLWWPGLRNLGLGFAVRARRGLFALCFDLHQALGAIAFVLLFMMTATGAIMGIPGASVRIARLLLPQDPPPPAAVEMRPQLADAAPLSVEGLVEAAERAGSAPVASLNFRQDGSPAAEAIVRPPGTDEEVRVLLTADGRTVDIIDRSRRTGAERVGRVLGRLHRGWLTSLIGRVVICAACLAGGVVALTGVVVWWLKRRRRLMKIQAAPALG